MDELFNNIEQTTTDNLEQGLFEALSTMSISYDTIVYEIKQLIKNVDEYDEYVAISKKSTPTITTQLQGLELKKNLIYKQFFIVQNLINAYIGQQIILTYVYIDTEGKRHIFINNNDVSSLEINMGINRGAPYYRLGYVMDQHYQNLKNSLPDDDNEGLQNTAMEVTRRFDAFKKRVLWFINNQWYGYQFYTKGPINEAFVNFYIHNIKLLNSLEENIDTFVLDKNFGAITADTKNGFLIGDTYMNGIHYAVKGVFGGPQGYRAVINDLKKLALEEFSQASFQNFIKKYTYQESQSNQARSLIKSMQDNVQQFIEDNIELIQNTINLDITTKI